MGRTVIGIDVGGSTTKIVGINQSRGLVAPMFVRAADPLTSIYGALGRFTDENGIALPDVARIMVTGVGAKAVTGSIHGVPCTLVNEFDCIGAGGLFLTGLERAVCVSMGTGTALVYSQNSGGAAKTVYLGGTGVGGGTLVGLSRAMLGMDNIDNIVALAGEGDLSKIDLRVGDIASGKIGLPPDMTAANFGHLSDIATKADLALGIMNLIFETVGMVSIFAARAHGVRDIILTGNLSAMPLCKKLAANLNNLFDINFIIPEHSQFAAVIGAALAGGND